MKRNILILITAVAVLMFSFSFSPFETKKISTTTEAKALTEAPVGGFMDSSIEK
jgi:hypothetical protein